MLELAFLESACLPYHKISNHIHLPKMHLIQYALSSVGVVAFPLLLVAVVELLAPGYVPSVLRDAVSSVINVSLRPYPFIKGALRWD